MKTKQYIKLPGIPNQKIRQKYYTPESISHPAKANIPMMIWILKKFCRDGEIILDPMAGIFTTGVEGMRLFPNSLFIGVELEDKFVKMARANIKKVEKIAKKDMFLKIGKAVCVQGDARDLSKILKEKVNKIITSPPFADSKHNYKHGLKELGKNFRGRRAWETRGQVNKIISSPPYAERYAYKDPEKKQKNDPYASKRNRIHKPYSQNPDNIGNLNYGTADKIISSPPFGQAQSGGGIAKKGYDGPKHTPTDMVGKRSYMPENVGDKNNISNLPYGQANKIITSPPYSEIRMNGGGKDRAGMRPYTDESADTSRTQRDQRNLGNLPHGKIDKIISSPPYSESLSASRKQQEGVHATSKPGAFKEGKVALSKSLQKTLQKLQEADIKKDRNWGKNRFTPGRIKGFQNMGAHYSENKNNIGNLKQETYLGEMLKVYQQCWQILRPQGLMILITKDFIRNKKRVCLGEDTIKLCQAAGFVFREIYYRKIEHPSFWRVLYQQKHPEVEKIDSEDILIFEKKS